ncbi:serine protease persephone-like isoform X2 [Agrilus planipennis]|uniref:Serine protease persephone-like isoform X2 n=1 Tax=Agrilus planipennis TaxID=224129 RepID=A0A7F5R798_AGRPL|nr:serine protease persephone-like isoform X2 [Agrilus planipennis]
MKEEDNPCDYTIGTCISVRNCPEAVNALKRERRHSFPRCGFEGFDEIVCCPRGQSAQVRTVNNSSNSEDDAGSEEVTSPSPKTTTRRHTTTTESNRSRRPSNRNPTVRKSESACEELSNEIRAQVSLQIFGGENAEPGEFPHMAAIGYVNEDGNDEVVEYKCGGSLIHKKFVLTAAHCLVADTTSKPVHVRLGKIDVHGNSDNLVAEDYRISTTFIHPEYNRRKREHDIALLRLKKRVKNTDYIHPACLFTKPENPEKVIVTGWGSTSYNDYKGSNVLQKAVLHSVPNTHCNQTYFSRLSQVITPSQLCAGSKDASTDTCQGDSGGPAQIEISEGNNMYYIVGVTSFGASCGGKVPGVYTRVNKHLDWIESIVWP